MSITNFHGHIAELTSFGSCKSGRVQVHLLAMRGVVVEVAVGLVAGARRIRSRSSASFVCGQMDLQFFPPKSVPFPCFQVLRLTSVPIGQDRSRKDWSKKKHDFQAILKAPGPTKKAGPGPERGTPLLKGG